MKKSIFINISIISNIWISYFFQRLFDEEYIVIILILFTWAIRKIFISRENSLAKPLRIIIFTLCGVNYLFQAAILTALIFNYSLLLQWATEVGFIIYLFTIMGYFKFLFESKDSNTIEKEAND